jgi:hypothetical protein
MSDSDAKVLCHRCGQRESEAEVIVGTVFFGSLCGPCRAALLDPYGALVRELADLDAGAAEQAFLQHPKVRRIAEELGHEPSPLELLEGLSRSEH